MCFTNEDMFLLLVRKFRDISAIGIGMSGQHFVGLLSSMKKFSLAMELVKRGVALQHPSNVSHKPFSFSFSQQTNSAFYEDDESVSTSHVSIRTANEPYRKDMESEYCQGDACRKEEDDVAEGISRERRRRRRR
jgi:hypothetical protein